MGILKICLEGYQLEPNRRFSPPSSRGFIRDCLVPLASADQPGVDGRVPDEIQCTHFEMLWEYLISHSIHRRGVFDLLLRVDGVCTYPDPMRVHGSPLWVAEVTRPPAGIYVLRSLEGRVIGRWDGTGWEASLAESVPLESLIDFGAPSVGDILALATWADAVESSGLGLDENLLTAVVAAHTRGVPGVAERAGAIRLAAAAWVEFWDGRLDLEALAWETAEHLRDITIASEQIERATTQAQRYWAGLYGDDPLLLSLPGMGPMTAPTIRAFLGDGTRFVSAKAAASYVGLTPSTWSSGTVVQPSRAITKEGPAALRLAFYQAANGARRVDPQLAAYYQHLMVERGHCHTQATVAVARKLVERTWTVLTRGQPYQFRDTTGQPVTRIVAKDQARHDHAVPDDVRARARARSAATHRSKLTK